MSRHATAWRRKHGRSSGARPVPRTQGRIASTASRRFPNLLSASCVKQRPAAPRPPLGSSAARPCSRRISAPAQDCHDFAAMPLCQPASRPVDHRQPRADDQRVAVAGDEVPGAGQQLRRYPRRADCARSQESPDRQGLSHRRRNPARSFARPETGRRRPAGCRKAAPLPEPPTGTAEDSEEGRHALRG